MWVRMSASVREPNVCIADEVSVWIVSLHFDRSTRNQRAVAQSWNSNISFVAMWAARLVYHRKVGNVIF